MCSYNNRATQQDVLDGEFTVIDETSTSLTEMPVNQLSTREQTIIGNTKEQLLEVRAREALAQAGERTTEGLVVAQMDSFLFVAETLDTQAKQLQNTGRAVDVQKYVQDKLQDFAAMQKQRLHRVNQKLAEAERQALLTEADKGRRGPLIKINIG